MSKDTKTIQKARHRRMRNLLAGAFALGLSGTAAHGQDFEQNLIAQLQSQGYAQIQVERTLLGRVRILALQNGVMREIVLNPRTGEVLRDVMLSGADSSSKGNSGPSGSARSVASGGNSNDDDDGGNNGNSSNDDDGDDDSGDDGDDDDRSGGDNSSGDDDDDGDGDDDGGED